MHRRLLDVLADPETHEPLTLADDTGAEWIEHGTLATASGRSYPIIRGVPRFVGSERYSGSFGLQWNRFAAAQLDSRTGNDFSRQRFDAEVGWGKTEIGDAWVVEAGCGAGRFTEIAAANGAQVVAVDLSSAVDAVRDSFGDCSNVHPVQADLTRLPLRAEAIAGLYSLGVLQHTPNPLASARALVRFLRPGARFALSAYARRPWTRLYAKYWWRPVTRRIAPDRLLSIIERCMPVLFPVTSFLFSLPLLGRVFQFLVPVANYVDRDGQTRAGRYQEAILDTFDMLAPQYDRPVTAGEIEDALWGLTAALDVLATRPVVIRGVRGPAAVVAPR